MSDYILKFWPKQEIQEIKTSPIKTELSKSEIIADETEFWGKPAFNPGQRLNEYLEPKLDRSNPYFDTIKITIEENDYGVRMGSEDFEYIDRKNVITIKGGEGGFNNWNAMCDKLKEITGDDYEGGWEIL